MSRLENIGRNALWSTVANVLYTLAGFVGRYVFLRVLDETHLGISSLFTSLIGILSFADLGLSTAFTFCFYKPIEEKDWPHIQSLLQTFRKVMACIAAVVTVVGLAVIPFLRRLIQGGESIPDGQLVVYYLISLGKTVLSYWLVYKTCYVTACQKAYKLVPFTLGGNLATVALQICVLLVWRSYTAWALVTPLVTLVQYIFTDRYIKQNFPETVFCKAPPIPQADKRSIFSNVKATLLGKLGEICVNQTDSILVSSMVGVATNGLISNYELIKNSVLDIVTLIQNAVVPALGSLIATEDGKVQKNVLYTYMMCNYLMVGFAMCGIGILSSPFLMLVFGPGKIVDELTVTLMCVGFYFAYQSYALNAFPAAAGKLILGAWASLIEGVVNLFVSIVAVKIWGLPGVYVGTVISQVINYVIRGYTIFLGIYREKPYRYFGNTMGYFLSTLLAYGALWALRGTLMDTGVTLLGFAALTALTPVVFFGIAWLFWHRTCYGQETMGLIRQAVRVFLKRN